jgi:hypothetical protein
MVLFTLILFLLTLTAIYFYITVVLIKPKDYPASDAAAATANERVVFQEPEVSKPYMTNEHLYGDAEDNLDWSETDFVREQEGGFDPTKDAINAARRQFPFDWANLPPSANEFQRQQMLYVKSAEKQAASHPGQYNKETFKDIDAADVLPSDNMDEDTRMAKIIKSYVPIPAGEFAAPTKESVEEFVKKIYKPRGLIPMVKQRGDTNVYEIYETKEINPKIVYEDDLQEKPNLLEPLTDQENTVENFDGEAKDRGVAPKSVKTRAGRQSYANYNPELEVMFGPRMMWQQWG